MFRIWITIHVVAQLVILFFIWGYWCHLPWLNFDHRVIYFVFLFTRYVLLVIMLPWMFYCASLTSSFNNLYTKLCIRHFIFLNRLDFYSSSLLHCFYVQLIYSFRLMSLIVFMLVCEPHSIWSLSIIIVDLFHWVDHRFFNFQLIF